MNCLVKVLCIYFFININFVNLWFLNFINLLMNYFIMCGVGNFCNIF